MFWSTDDDLLANFVIGLSNLAVNAQPIRLRQIKLHRAWAKLRAARKKGGYMTRLREQLKAEASHT